MRSIRPIDQPHELHAQASVNQGVIISTKSLSRRVRMEEAAAQTSDSDVPIGGLCDIQRRSSMQQDARGRHTHVGSDINAPLCVRLRTGTRRRGSPAETDAGAARLMRGRLVDGRGSRRRMRGRLDVVERECQGQEAMFCVCRSVFITAGPIIKLLCARCD